MEKSLDLLMQDIVFLIKRSLENSFYCESLDLCQSIHVNISREALIQNYSDNEIKEAFENLYRLFFNEVKCNCKPTTIAMLRLIDMISFSETTIYFTTYQFYVNKLFKVDFCLKKIID
ncbi:hypothetical protein [Chryseobacterium sp. SIMBA_029]|uniref:hypothetical protein n=1 Tax=Chryseobacterium sp. SIMBA_029 TaxID=3085772 RepID=UPI00397BFC8A